MLNTPVETRMELLTGILNDINLKESPKHCWVKSSLLCELAELTGKLHYFESALTQLDRSVQGNPTFIIVSSKNASKVFQSSGPSFQLVLSSLFRAVVLYRKSFYSENAVVAEDLIKQAVELLKDVENHWPVVFLLFSCVVWFPETLVYCQNIYESSGSLPESFRNCLEAETMKPGSDSEDDDFWSK